MIALDAEVDLGAQDASRRETRSSTGLSPVDWVLSAAVLGAVLPIVVAMIARVASHWQPSDDEAAIARLSYDVFSSHSPLLGMPSTIAEGSKLAATGSPHHLGPMLFWLFAIPAHLSGGSPAALVITIALVNVASIAAVAWQVRRRLGPSAAVIAMVGVSLLLWSMGRDITVQIWNPYAALLPFLLYLVLAWSVACGDLRALPFAALVGSFVMQCHILYVFPVLGVGCFAVAALVIGPRDPALRVTRRARRRLSVATGFVLAACWAPTVYNQAFQQPGNVSRLWDSFNGTTKKPFGRAVALRYVARAIAPLPLFARRLPSASAFSALALPVDARIAAGAVVIGAALLIATIASWRRAPTEARLGLLALVLVGTSVYVVSRLPVELGGVAPYRARFLWIVGLYAWLALVLLLWRPVAAAIRYTAAHLVPMLQSRPLLAAVSAVVAVALVVGGALVARDRSPGYAVEPNETAAVTQLTDQIRDRVSYRGPYLLGFDGVRAFAVGYGVMWDLVRHGYDVRVVPDDPYLGAAHGVPVAARVPHLVVISSPPASHLVGVHRVAVFDGDGRLLAEQMHDDKLALIAALHRRGASLTGSGRRLLETDTTGRLADAVSSLAKPSPPWSRLLDDQMLDALIRRRLVAVSGPVAAEFSRFEALQGDVTGSTISVYITPPPT